MLKIGIVGARGLSTVLGFRDIEGVDITALCDLNEDVLKQYSQKYNIPHTYRVYEDMLDSDIDAVVIGSPMQCHVPHAIAALEAGKHVMSEVTAGVTMDELWWLIENVEKSGKVYMYAENYCYMPDMQVIRNMVRKGVFGQVYYGEGEYLHELNGLFVYGNGKSSWRSYWQCGKRGNFYPTHSLGPVMQWFEGDRIASISTFSPGQHYVSSKVSNVRLRQDDTTVTMINMESGGLIQIRVDCMSLRPHNLTYYQLQGTQGCYEAPRGLGDVAKIAVNDGDPNGFREWKPLRDYYDKYMPERYMKATDEQKNAGHWGGDFFIVQDFVNAIRTGCKPEIDVYQAAEWTAVGLLSELSVTNGNRLMEMPKFRKNMPLSEQIIKL
ncbi:MAG: Gfo/Idh/MocA family oxidoreductase [Clostridia bacterium]|nr:Gfo/Idh/MocA family oxidoreductase [Clostridia bacterium]